MYDWKKMKVKWYNRGQYRFKQKSFTDEYRKKEKELALVFDGGWVLNPSLDGTAPISDINKVENGTFIPNLDDYSKLDQNFLFHIMNVLVKYVDCLNKYKDCLPKYIPHPHLEELSGKSNFAILDMLDKSENKAKDMLSILEHIHENYIPRTNDENPSVIKKSIWWRCFNQWTGVFCPVCHVEWDNRLWQTCWSNTPSRGLTSNDEPAFGIPLKCSSWLLKLTFLKGMFSVVS